MGKLARQSYGLYVRISSLDRARIVRAFAGADSAPGPVAQASEGVRVMGMENEQLFHLTLK